MIRTSVLGIVVLVATLTSGLPDKRPTGYAPPPVSYNTPPIQPSYGPPEPVCYPKHVTKTMTKDIQATSMNYGTKYKKNPSTIYASITETVVSPKTVILYSTMTAYAEPEIKTQTKLLTDTKHVTKANYHQETKYGYTTAQHYFTETNAVYVTKTETQKYPLTHDVTNVNIKTNAYYVTQTKVQTQYQTITVNNPYYVTQYETQYQTYTNTHTNTATVHHYATNTVWVEVPEYHTVTKCDSYSQGGAYPAAAPTSYPQPPAPTYGPAPATVYHAPKPSGYPPARKPSKGYGY